MTKMKPYEIVESLTPEQGRGKTAPDVEIPEGLVWVKTIFGDWGILDKSSRHIPCVDPSYETYWSM